MFSVTDVFEMYRAGGKLRPQLVVLNTCTTCQNSGNAGEEWEIFLLGRALIASNVTTSGSYGNGNFADILWLVSSAFLIDECLLYMMIVLALQEWTPLSIASAMWTTCAPRQYRQASIGTCCQMLLLSWPLMNCVVVMCYRYLLAAYAQADIHSSVRSEQPRDGWKLGKKTLPSALIATSLRQSVLKWGQTKRICDELELLWQSF